MTNDPILHLLVSDPESESDTSADDRGGRGIDEWPGQVKSAVKSILHLKPVEVPVSAIRPHMEELLKVVNQLFSQTDRQPGLALDEIELSVDINAKGQVRILGSGAEVGSTGSIKLKFKRVP
jgi:hypothetical protein